MYCLTVKSQNKIADLRILSGKITSPAVGFAFFYFLFYFWMPSFQSLQFAKDVFGAYLVLTYTTNILFHLLECLCWFMEPKGHRMSCRKTPLGTIDAISDDATWISQLLWFLITQTACRDHSHSSFLCHYLIKSLLLCDHQTSAWRKRTSLCIYVWCQRPKEHSHKMINDELTKVLYFFQTASPNPKWNFIWFVPPCSYFFILSLMNKLKHLCLCFRPL